MKLKSRYRWTNSMTKGLNHNLQNWLFGRWQRIIKNPRSFCRINNIKMFSYKALFCYWHPFSSLEVCLVRGSKKKKLEATAFWNTYDSLAYLSSEPKLWARLTTPSSMLGDSLPVLTLKNWDNCDHEAGYFE